MYKEENALIATGDDRRLQLSLTGKMDIYYIIHLVERCYLSARGGRQQIIIELIDLDYVDRRALEFLRDSLDVLRWHTRRIKVITSQVWVAAHLKSAGIGKVCSVILQNPFLPVSERRSWLGRIAEHLSPTRLLARFCESPRPLRAIGPSILVTNSPL